MNISGICLLALLLAGCSYLMPIPVSYNDPTPVQLRLACLLHKDYQLPAQSIAPTPHPDAEVNAAIHAMEELAAKQGLLFDGSPAADGAVLVGRVGSTRQMVMAIAVYRDDHGVAVQDVCTYGLPDASECMRMKKRFLDALVNPPE